MLDLTIIYYTANTMQDSTGQKVRDYLLEVTENKYPIISVSQKPIDFGKNICVGKIGRSKYNCYKQILTGALAAKTKYVACAEDDTLYSTDHFLFRPPHDETFYYDNNMWFAEGAHHWTSGTTPARFWRRENIKRGGMWGCITSKKALVKNLTKRYSLYPKDPLSKNNKFPYWAEPGSHDELFGMKNNCGYFFSEKPTIVFRYLQAMEGFKSRHESPKPENICYNVEPFGGAAKLWNFFWS